MPDEAPHQFSNSSTGSESKKEEEKKRIEPLRTLQADAARFVKEKGVTLSSIITGGSKERDEETSLRKRMPRGPVLKKALVIFFALLLAGFGAIIFLGRGEQDENVSIAQKPAKPPLLYPAFDEREIPVVQSPSEFLNGWQPLLDRNFPKNQMLGVFVFHEQKNIFLPPGSFFEFLSISVPSPLLNSMEKNWTLGVFGTDERAKPVFIIPVSSFNDAFKGMLDWEKDLPFAFRNILPKDHPTRASFEQFEDVLILNHNVRVLKNESGAVLFAYTFFDRRILIISTTPSVIEGVLNRFLLVPPLKAG